MRRWIKGCAKRYYLQEPADKVRHQRSLKENRKRSEESDIGVLTRARRSEVGRTEVWSETVEFSQPHSNKSAQ